MIQIRNDVFETNSSSAHTIAIKKQDEYDYDFDWWLKDNGVLDLWTLTDIEFGRSPFEILYTTMEKLPYFIATFGFKKMEKIILSCCPNIKHILPPTCSYYEDDDFKGGIDHQSDGMLKHFIKKHNISIEEALFNKKYMIIIDGDEYQVWNDMVHNNIINKEIFDDTGTSADF